VPRKGRGRPKKRPARVIGDKAYDSDPLRKRCKELKIDLIVPDRRNRKRSKKQDGRKLRRYRKRWKVERTFSWISNFRCLVVRYERPIEVYKGFFHLAIIMIVLKYVLKPALSKYSARIFREQFRFYYAFHFPHFRDLARFL
jgi:transposase